ncbi:ATP-grasp domain-containing protein [Haloactinomyces albus]|uniref:Biotin carboxylase n=1 Tax=Haloactinomyces albus TaxID=1352928 RepID=A0AAE3ZCB0_9ACTN|nr:ATP-grasp domain-containing protein [Haloactinomyces albus]MDR7301220.1 biotin carboxylase [Haloactinomyces albus]
MPLTATERTVVLIGVGGMAEGYLSAAETMGLRVGVVETADRCGALASRFSCIADFEPVEEGAQDEAWLAPATVLADRMRPRGVLGFAEPHVLATAILQHRLGVPGPGLDAAVISRNKALQRGEFERADLPQPGYLHDRLQNATEWALPRLPVVVKPVSMQGSRGVERIDTPEEWQDALARRGSEGPLLVEEYVEGHEYSVEALVENGRVLFTNLTRKETTGAPFFVELLHEAGYGTERPVLRKASEELCRKVVAAMGVSTGIVHLEFRTPIAEELVIMEVAVRTPGDHLMEIVSRAHGVDIYEACLRLALQETPELPPGSEPARSAGSLFLSAECAGTLVALDLADWASHSGVARYGIRLSAGTPVRPAESSGDRLAYAVLDCANAEEMRRLAEELRVSASCEIAEGSPTA